MYLHIPATMSQQQQLKIYIFPVRNPFLHTLGQGHFILIRGINTFLLQHNIVCSRTTPYNPEGNGLVGKHNGAVWKSITLALKSRTLPKSHWETVLPNALHTIRHGQ